MQIKAPKPNPVMLGRHKFLAKGQGEFMAAGTTSVGVGAAAKSVAKRRGRLLDRMVALAGAAIVVPTCLWAQAPSGGADYGYGPHQMMWGFGMIFGPLFLLLVLALVIAVAVLLVRWLAGPWQGASQPVPPGRTALDILRERFARGEIDRNEFEERRRVLGD